MRVGKYSNFHNFCGSQNDTCHKKNTFKSFASPTFDYPKIPLALSMAYVSPQINSQYTKLETFKLPNTGEGSVYKLRNGHKIVILPKKVRLILIPMLAQGKGILV